MNQIRLAETGEFNSHRGKAIPFRVITRCRLVLSAINGVLKVVKDITKQKLITFIQIGKGEKEIGLQSEFTSSGFFGKCLS